MSEFAFVDTTNTVLHVICADQQFITEHGDEVKQTFAFPEGAWIAVPENTVIGKGFTYDTEQEIFVTPPSPLPPEEPPIEP